MKPSRLPPATLRLLAAATLLIVWMSAACSKATPQGSGNTEPVSPPLAPCSRTENVDPTKKALVIGIDDYSAAGLPAPSGGHRTDRDWYDLEGAVNDADAIYQLLTCRHGFAPANVRLLRNRQATREAISRAIREVLIEPTKKGDQLVFYFSGHGSQVVNSKAEEPDKKDESLVPADSRLGADDIRDKQLRRLFNEAIDKGARLSVILDSCHSGSGARGPVWPRARRIEPDSRDVADGAPTGPPIENRGALVLSAAQDFQSAFEAWDETGQRHGALSLALLRALRTAPVGEPATELFARIRAFLAAETPRQDPVLAGGAAARSAPLFGERTDQSAGRTVAGVEKIDTEGRAVLDAGWINGLAVGSRLAEVDAPADRRAFELEVTALDGLTRSQAKVATPAAGATTAIVAPGQLFVLSGWATPPGPPLSIWIPEAPDSVRAWATELLRQASAAGVVLDDDPAEPPGATHVLGWGERGWYLSGPGSRVEPFGASPNMAAVLERLQALAAPARVFVQIPVAPVLARKLEIGAGTARSKVEPVDTPGRAVYLLTGRLKNGVSEYSWMLRGMTTDDAALPPRSRWLACDPATAASIAAAAGGLSADAAGLARVYSWLHLESPPRGASPAFPYHLALKPSSPGAPLKTEGRLVEREQYGLVLRAEPATLAGAIRRHYVYAFSIDGFGRRTLLFPPPGLGNVENHFPLDPTSFRSPAGFPDKLRIFST